MPTDYALAAVLRARVMGIFLVLVGVLVCAAMVLVLVLRLPLDVMSAVVILVLVAVVAMGYLLNTRWWVVRTDADGYRVRFVRGAGVARGRWSDVEDMVTADVAGAPCVVLRLRDGGSTTIPVELLARDREEFVRELRAHLGRPGGAPKRSADH